MEQIMISPVSVDSICSVIWASAQELSASTEGPIDAAQEWTIAASRYDTLYLLLEDAEPDAAALCVWLADSARAMRSELYRAARGAALN